MENRINNLEDLMSFIVSNKIELSENMDTHGIDSIFEGTITGGEGINNIPNRLFTYKFSSNGLEDIRRIFNNLKLGQINNGKIFNSINELRAAARDMRVNGSFPLEAILYASKEINSLLCNNELLVDSLGNFIKEIYDTSDFIYKKAIKYIIENWKWIPQLNIVVNACGKIKDEELLELIYVNISDDIKVESFKAFINSGLESSIPHIMKCMANVQDGDMISNRVCKYFNEYYKVNFGEEGLRIAREYLMIPQLSRRAKKEINKILPVAKTDGFDVTLGDMINLAKDREFENFSIYVNQQRLRRNVYISLRWAPKDIESAIKTESIVLKGLNNCKNNTSEINEALITLSVINSDKLESIATKFLRENLCIEYCYAALLLRGHSNYEDKLLDIIFEHQSISGYNALKQCKSKMLNKTMDRLDKYLVSNDPEKIVKSLMVSVELINNNLIDVNVIIMDILKKLLEKNYGYENEKVRAQFIKTIELIFNEKTRERLIPLLFKVIDHELSTITEKAKAKALLLSVGVDVPK